MIKTVAPVGAMLVLIAACTARTTPPPDAGESAPAPPPASAAEPPAEPALEQTPPAPPTDAQRWLEKIETAARATRTLQARLRWDRVQGLVGDEQRRFGKLIYVAGPPSRFAVHFDRLLLDGGRVEEQDRWWIFDGAWLVERLDDKKQFFKRQIADPADNATDPLAEGAGPFPIPLRAGKEDLLRRFEVSVVEPTADDPENTVHLRLEPREADAEYSRIELWYDRDTVLPVRARTVKERSRDEQVFHLFDVQRDEPVDESQIDTRLPSQRGQTGWFEQVD